MSLKCFIVDDEPHALAILSDYINKTPGLELCGTSRLPLVALKEISDIRPDIVFLDVDMPDLSGLEMAALVRERATVVFTTSFREYALEAFETNAADYLLKPIGFERFLTSIQKVRKILSPSQEPKEDRFFFVKTDVKGKMLKINFADIRYIQSLNNYVELYLTGEKIIAYLTLSELEAQLPSRDFSRIQKSFIVAHHFIRSVEHAQVRLLDGTLLPIGEHYSDTFKLSIYPNLINSKRKA